MAKNPIERALGVWSAANYRNVMLPGLGVVTCGELCDAIAALKAENERLEIAKREAIAGWKEAERALAERAGGVKVRELVDGLLDLRDLITRGKRCVTDTGPAVKPVIELASVHILDDAANALEALTTEPAAPEERQDDEPRAYIVHAPEDDYYGTGPDRLQFHPLAQHDLDNGYRQTPLYTRPAEQAVTEAEQFDRADWYWRVMDPDDSGDTPEQAIHGSMLGDLVVCEIASSFTGPTRFGFTAPVLDEDSDETEFLHFATAQEAIEAAKERGAALKAAMEAGRHD